MERDSISVLLRLTTIDVVDEVVVIVVDLMRHKMVGVCFEVGEKDLEVSFFNFGLWRMYFYSATRITISTNLVSPGLGDRENLPAPSMTFDQNGFSANFRISNQDGI
jgi:hypothetical protein